MHLQPINAALTKVAEGTALRPPLPAELPSRVPAIAPPKGEPAAFATSALFRGSLDGGIAAIEDLLSRGHASGALLDRYDRLTSLRTSRDETRVLTQNPDPRVTLLLKSVLREIAEAALIDKDAGVASVRSKVNLLKDYAAADEKRAKITAEFQTGLPLPLGLIPGGKDSLLGEAKVFFSGLSPLGRLTAELQDSENPADRKVATAASAVIADLDWLAGVRSEAPWTFESLEKETTRLKSVYGAPEIDSFLSLFRLSRETEAAKALTALKARSVLAAAFENHRKEGFVSVTSGQLYEIRGYLLDRLRAERRRIHREILEDTTVEGPFALHRTIRVPKELDEDGKAVTDPARLDGEHRRVSILNVTETNLLRLDLSDCAGSVEMLEIGGRTIFKKADEQMGETLKAMTTDDDLRTRLDRFSRREDVTEDERLKFYGKILSTVTVKAYQKLVQDRIERLKKAVDEIGRANETVGAAALAACTGPLSCSAVKTPVRGRDEDQPFGGAEKAASLRAEYEKVKTGLESSDPKALARALKTLKRLHASDDFESVEQSSGDAALFNEFTLGLVVVGAAAATGGLAASLVPESLAGTSLGGFLRLGANAAGFTLSQPLYRAALTGEEPLPWKSAEDLGGDLLMNTLVFGGLQETARMFGSGFQRLLKTEAAQTVWKNALVKAGFQAGSLTTQTGTLQLTFFARTAVQLEKSGHPRPLERAFELAFSPKTVAKEFLFLLALHLQLLPLSIQNPGTGETAKDVERTLIHCGVRKTSQGRYVYAEGKKDFLLGLFLHLEGLGRARDAGFSVQPLGDVLRVSIRGEEGVRSFTFLPASQRRMK